ncbi:MAG: hypothetical protein Fur0034_15650 [Desulfuromonadia bacterium]
MNRRLFLPLQSLLFTFFLILVTTGLIWAREVGVVTLEGESLSADKNGARKIISLLEREKKGGAGKILEIEGGVYDSDPARAVERSYRLASEAYSLIEESRKNFEFDIYISATRMDESGKGRGRIRILLHDDRFEKIGVGTTVLQPAVPQSPPPGLAAPSQAAAPQVSVPTDSSPPSGFIPPARGRQLTPEELREIDERTTSEQARRAQELIDRAKIKAAERQRRRLLEESREAERLKREQRDAERSATHNGTSQER